MANTKTKFGRSKFGGSPAGLIAMSLVGGVVLAAAFAALMVWLQDPARVTLYFGVYFWVTLPVLAAASWALLVDRETITGAVRNPENSVENTWYAEATKDAFHVLMVLGGIGCIVFSVRPVDAPLSMVFLGLVLLLQVCFWISYNIRKHQAS